MDQTIKNLVREVDWKKKFSSVKNTVLNISPLEAKVREVTSNDPWAASATDKQIVADHTHNSDEFRVVMSTLWRRMNDSGKNWRHVHKALQLLEYLVIHGSDRVIDEARQNVFTIRTLRNFRFVDEKGKDQGAPVREMANNLAALLKDEKEIRKKKRESRKNKDKYAGISAADARYQVRRSRRNDRAPSPPRYDDDDDEDSGRERYRDRRDSFHSDNSSTNNRRYRSDGGDDDDDGNGYRRQNRKDNFREDDNRGSENSVDMFAESGGSGSGGGFRPRKVSQAGNEGTAPTRIRAPSFGSSGTLSRQQQPQAPATAAAAVQEANIFDVSDFFDTPQQPAAASSHQRQLLQQQQQYASPQQDWSANFAANDAFGDDQWGNFPSSGSTAANNHNHNNHNHNHHNQSVTAVISSNNGLDDAFPEDDDFSNFQPGVVDDKKQNDLWDVTKDLVQLDLGERQTSQHRPTNSPSQKQAAPQKMSLREMQKKQGGTVNRPAPSTFSLPPGPAVAPLTAGGPFGGQPPMGFGGQPPMGYGGQFPMGYGMGGMPPMGYGNPPPFGYPPQMGGGMMQQWGPQQQQQPPQQQQQQPSVNTQSASADDFFF